MSNDQQRLIQLKSRGKHLEREIAELTHEFENLDSQLEVNNPNDQKEKLDEVLASLDLHNQKSSSYIIND